LIILKEILAIERQELRWKENKINGSNECVTSKYGRTYYTSLS
jgi:hypothetical protein